MTMNFTIAATHPSLAGHFPGNPVVPGVVILDEVINIIKNTKPGMTISAMPNVKFIQPLLAEQSVDVELTEKNDTTLSFTCSYNNNKLVTGQVTLKSQS